MKKAKLEPKPGHVVPDQAGMRRLVGLDRESQSLGGEEEEDVSEVDDDEETEALLHADVLDSESRATLRTVRDRTQGSSSSSPLRPAEEAEERGLGHLNLDSEDATASSDVIELNRRGRWFGAVVELGRKGEEDVETSMRRHFQALRG